MNQVTKSQYQELEEATSKYIEKLEQLDSLPIPVTIRVQADVPAQYQRLGAVPDEPFEIKVPLLLAILSGWRDFHLWLKKTYGKEDGTIDTFMGYKVGKAIRIAINALKFIVFGIIKRVNQLDQ